MPALCSLVFVLSSPCFVSSSRVYFLVLDETEHDAFLVQTCVEEVENAEYVAPLKPLLPMRVEDPVDEVTRSRGGPGHGTLRWTRASEQAGKALRSQGHHCAHVM